MVSWERTLQFPGMNEALAEVFRYNPPMPQLPATVRLNCQSTPSFAGG